MQVLWSTNKYGKSWLIMQYDGDFIIYTKSNFISTLNVCYLGTEDYNILILQNNGILSLITNKTNSIESLDFSTMIEKCFY